MMEMKRKSLTVTAFLVLFLFSAMLVLAKPGGQMKHHGNSQKAEEKTEKSGGMMGMMSGMMGMMPGPERFGMRDMESKMQRHFAFCLQNADKLGLSEEQIEQLKKIHNEKRKKLIMLKAEIRVIDVDLSAELEKDIPDLEKLEKLLKKQEGLKTKYRLELMRTRVESSKVLTEEQRKKLKTLMMGGMMSGMKGGMMGSSGGSMRE